MRIDEAVFYLSSPFVKNLDDKMTRDAYTAVLKKRWHFRGEPRSSIAEPYVSLYVNNGVLKVLSGVHAYDEHYFDSIASMPYSELFKECYNLKYEHWINPDCKVDKRSDEYETSNAYYDFETMIEEILEKESKEYFLTKVDYLMIPSCETQTAQMWQFLIQEGPYDSYYYCIGRVTIPKTLKS